MANPFKRFLLRLMMMKPVKCVCPSHTLVNNLMIKFLTIKFYNPYNRFNVVLIDDRPRIQQHYTIKSIPSFYSSKLNHMKSSNIMNIYQVSLVSRWYTSFDLSFEKIF